MMITNSSQSSAKDEAPASVGAFISALGGRTQVSKIVARGVTSVSNWLADGIPTKHFNTLVTHGKNARPRLRWLTHEYLDTLNKDRGQVRTDPQQEGQSIAA